jgi:2'-hydroxyisoflavone reductase
MPAMKLLVLGGTVFLGRHIVEQALAQGLDVTLFNRGRRAPALFPAATRLVGDRDGDVEALRGRRFDAVIDCSGYTPGQMDRTADVLGDVPHYVFVSSVSVYAAFPPGVRFDETTPRLAGHEGYGALKARAEEAIEARLPGRVAHVRPGLIVGPHDPTGRFTYWPVRVARGGRVLAPGRPARPVQYVDVRDLAAWCLVLARARTAGPFNAVTPPLPMARLLDACVAATGSDAQFVWRPDAEVVAAGIAPWTGLPLWLPEDDPAFGGMMLGDGARAAAAGLVHRPLIDTVRDTADWAAHDPGAMRAPKGGLDAAAEAAALAGH